METKLKILGFAGSLRAGSYNKALLRAATELLPSVKRISATAAAVIVTQIVDVLLILYMC